jgi:hypothetical protein
MTKDPHMNTDYAITLASSGALIFCSGDTAADLEAAFTKHEVTPETKLVFWSDGSLLMVAKLGEALKHRTGHIPAKYR